MEKKATPHQPQLPAVQKKPAFPVNEGLRGYLRSYRRARELPLSYERLLDFHEAMPLPDARGEPTLWDSVVYRAEEMGEIFEGLKRIYALLKVDGDFSIVEHLYIDRVDFCSFGNSTPFRVRIVNAYNDNQDYFYVKKADASRIYGLELEHLLSPNRLNFLVDGATLAEEHIIGIPGDIFIADWLEDQTLRPIRVAKEMVKFNERCFVRLLGDMRSYNYVVAITPDFDDAQVRIRAMDFDQQSYGAAKNSYLPQFFKENLAVVRYCLKHLHVKTALQYQREEQTLMAHRAGLAAQRLGLLLDEMSADPIAPIEHVRELRAGLAEHYGRDDYLRCESMGALVRENLESIRLLIGRPARPELLPKV
ncbi:MAG TPA: hypothetical protein VG710_16725 [Opitutus sp.]|nr:hypothetical protein [Opitutus sp.]